jgi:oxepin-CoA hydrolase/3-oxo-5,6-dehydrosuberyl-CoA semialdehyde dehydrogenase
MSKKTTKTQSYVLGKWVAGEGEGQIVKNAVNSEPIASVSSDGIDIRAVIEYGRQANQSLRQLSIHERGRMVKAVALHLLEKKESFYQLSLMTGATRADSWIDIEGGIGTALSISSAARRELTDQPFAVETSVDQLSPEGDFMARHILTPRRGVAVHINAYNFPCWGMLEKIAPCLIAGMPAIVKPAPVTGYLTEAMVREILATDILPEGALQLVSGEPKDLLDYLDERDLVTFTGSAATGQLLKSHPNIIKHSIPFNMEADSLNCSVLGATVKPESIEFKLFIKEVAREMTIKAGQKCTAIRRVIVPADKLDLVAKALQERLAATVIGNPANDKVRMGALVSMQQRQSLTEQVSQLEKDCELLFGGQKAALKLVDANADKGAFYPPTLMLDEAPLKNDTAHNLEAFGPVSTLMPYQSMDDAIEIAHRGKGSLVGSIVSNDSEEIAHAVWGMASSHGRLLVLNEECAKSSTGHGAPLAQLVHGGPGRAGGGEELGGARSIMHYFQRTAVQGSPNALTSITREYHRGAQQHQDATHPFRKNFEELKVGDTLMSYRRTVTEADIVNFGCISGDHFYAHFDETAAEDSLFGKRVAHGYYLISVAAGMFVDPAPGPVLANYGIDNLRFIEPVGIGDTIRVRLTVKNKTSKDKRPDDKYATGVVKWDVEIYNQNDDTVAAYDILTLVQRS